MQKDANTPTCRYAYPSLAGNTVSEGGLMRCQPGWRAWWVVVLFRVHEVLAGV
ncbi:hypothetical protein [Mobiluncus mulieris]|uniref:hypothetical protein n=1 Tax=Mobiluncus mulieris TaxID=2052 RepID=UPI00147896AF|nr:hypothetical protein [Mobiluncus mulieris]